ncbi:hypothetical protein JCM1840_002769 [Sporobolomyces johnsonii]
MSADIPAQFTGYAATTEEAGKRLELEKWSYTPQKWSEDDVDIKVDCCGVCGSCIHVLTNGWPSPTQYPAIAGHEIVGTVVRAGANTKHKVGDRVGVGAQAGSCRECEWCHAGKEQFCTKGQISTYQGKWPDGTISQGGYANFTRVNGKLALKIPESLKSEEVAPLLCAGVTVYSPLRRFHAGPGKKVGVIGIGGLGHLALQISNALGAETYALSHSDKKVADADKLGVHPDHFIVYKDHAATIAKWANTFDLILCTSSSNDIPVEALYFKLLRPEGTLVLCSLPEEKLPAMHGHALVVKSVTLAGSFIGGTVEIEELLELAVKHDIKAWVETRPMTEATQTLQDMHAGKARYRYVLKN